MCRVLADVGVGLISGDVGTKLMEPVGMKLYELESEADRQQEDEVWWQVCSPERRCRF